MNGICTIEIEGKKVKLFFGLIALERFKDKVKQYDLLSTKMYSIAAIAHLLYSGYVNGCFISDESIDIPFSTFYEYAENASLSQDYEGIHTAIANFEASKFVKGAAQPTDTEEKKSQVI